MTTFAESHTAFFFSKEEEKKVEIPWNVSMGHSTGDVHEMWSVITGVHGARTQTLSEDSEEGDP